MKIGFNLSFLERPRTIYEEHGLHISAKPVASNGSRSQKHFMYNIHSRRSACAIIEGSGTYLSPSNRLFGYKEIRIEGARLSH